MRQMFKNSIGEYVVTDFESGQSQNFGKDWVAGMSTFYKGIDSSLTNLEIAEPLSDSDIVILPSSSKQYKYVCQGVTTQGQYFQTTGTIELEYDQWFYDLLSIWNTKPTPGYFEKEYSVSFSEFQSN